ncbi:aminodeoxychorismate lyase [Bacillus niameyensis]|uniref:aminodeoxychorismate lyase n=1 Tax=Bacillus niameyensis TaxID=1522308 RepID=UPI000780C5F4|nr:aminodeoxychorismate lyase [Bacillus niameyensis]
MYIYVNGQYIRKEEAVISPFDHGYLYGLGVFETFRTYKCHPFLLDDHLERLNKGLQELGIMKEFHRNEVMEIIGRLVELNGLPDSYIRFNVSAGIGEIGLQTAPYDGPTIIMFQKSLAPTQPNQEKEAVIVSIPRNTPETIHRLKSHHFFNNVAAKREIGSDTQKEGIFLTKEGFLAEGITSNLFWVQDDVLYTPSLETGILNGITRKWLITMAKRLGINLQEDLFSASALNVAQEIFFTNSIQEIVPVYKLGKKLFPGKEGKLYQKFHKEYKKCVNTHWSIEGL